MQTSDIISSFALFFSIIIVPISYYLGVRNIKNSTYNNEIDSLSELLDKIYNEAIDIHQCWSKETVDIHTQIMIANHKRLQTKCSRLQDICSSNYPRNELRRAKQILTDHLLSEDEAVRKTAIRDLIYRLDDIQACYKKMFF
ncbi:hypothetical protein F9874_10110 [Glaesserella parasuis]|uniref:Uncharacterized protein n=1 Tax=Glaesserella parasuis TaxID=738 RepID=A0A859IH73_GLAPU|nr:hypothetical protein [Glaesserella parasuis]MDO9758051.1 hypothetical protein [Glaesserella parasuis]MDP0299284.1 hypothetical protein [Glaesserella parasuis]MWQ00612.1 hypothetical protein [Glaesserella parasuis]MWQ45905.1 hypothetical protein [Glaesserella parasuis]MWQ62485.1 hypothetical protein [Glaesserella parasuis]